MTDHPMNNLRSAELKRRGIAVIEALIHGPVHLFKRNQPAAVVRSMPTWRRIATGDRVSRRQCTAHLMLSRQAVAFSSALRP
jgi:hypothetical protein